MVKVQSMEKTIDRLLRLPDVLNCIPVSRSSWYLGIQQGKYPPGLLLGPRTRAWPASDIQALINKIKSEAA